MQRLGRARAWLAIGLVAASMLGCLCPPAPPEPAAVRIADWIMARWPDPQAINDQGWEYNTGIVLYAMSRVYELKTDPCYLDYIRRWVDSYVGSDGRLDLGGAHNLDRIQPATLLIFLYRETGDERYRIAAQRVREQVESFPRNAEGGFWHKERYPNEMWLDSLYMAGVLLAQYGALFDDAACIDTAVFQATLLARHAQDPETGLLRHAWDEDRNAAWADPATGLSPEVWSRGLGWYAMALVEILQVMPEDHPGFQQLQTILQELARGLRGAQDRKTGLWYQVVDKGDRPDNWTETSGSAMLVYALQIGVERGYLDASYGTVARRGWRGLRARILFDADGAPTISGAVEGMGVQMGYAEYVNKERLTNSTHGLMAIMLASSQMERESGRAQALPR
jgi:unsaturated rhamnogalacturonyl hydrolase